MSNIKRIAYDERTVEKQKRQKLPTTAAEVKANTSRNFLVFTLNLEQRYEKKNFVVAFYYL